MTTIKFSGKRFKEIRQTLELNQADFAQTLGISQALMAEIEIGNKKPTVGIMTNLIEQHNVNLNYLFDERAERFVNV